MNRLFQRALLAAFTAVPLIPPLLLAGSGGQSSAYTVEGDADREITRRQQDLIRAEEALKRGDEALKAGNLEQAYLAYKEAVDLVPDGSASRSLHARALARYCSTAIRYAEFLVSEGQYAKAEAVAREVLEPRYNPGYQPAAVFLSRLEQPDYFNKTITPEFAEDRVRVEKLLREANGYFDSARYDLALKSYQKVLAIDKYNAAAFRGMEQVELGKQRYYDSAYNETRSRMLWQVEKAWERPKRRFVEARTTDSSALAEERRGTELMVARLNRIIIPRVNLSNSTVREAVSFLQQESRALDTTETDADRRGINIVLKLPSTPAPAPAALEVEGETPAVPAYSPNSRITLNLANVPLYEALRYVATLAGLKVKVDPFAVSIVPLNEPTESLVQREFTVPPGFISATGEEESGAQSVGGRQVGAPSQRLTARQNAQAFLQSQDVPFPPGASAQYNPNSSQLVVRNTPTNLDLIEALVDAATRVQPTQVEIEAKFVEISQNNLKELGFDWALGPFQIGDSGVYGGGGGGISTDATGPIPLNTVTSGLRTGSGPQNALTLNSLNALLASNVGATAGNGPAPAFFSLAGIYSNLQFEAIIRALNQKKGVDLMAAPKVIAQNAETATINITREFPYPQQFEPPQIPDETSGNNQQNIVLVPNPVNPQQNQNINAPVVTPSFPTDFTTRNLGVILQVTPQVGPDGYTIDLELSPEVTDFDGFVNYGSPIFAPVPNTLLQNAANLALNPLGSATSRPEPLTENVINQPIFSVRKVTTAITIWDGQTVALGGLIREDVQKVNDKVPILGDIPVAGTLFRSEVDQKIKQNLIIFVTARLMDPAGQPLRPEDDIDQEEVVEPLGLPEDLRKPSITAKGFRQK